MLLRKLFGLFFMFYAIAIPMAVFNANNFRGTKNLIAMAGFMIVEFLFLYFGIKLLRKKTCPGTKVLWGRLWRSS